MTSGELSELSQFAKDSILEFNRSRLAPPVEYCANDFDMRSMSEFGKEEIESRHKLLFAMFAKIWNV